MAVSNTTLGLYQRSLISAPCKSNDVRLCSNLTSASLHNSVDDPKLQRSDTDKADGSTSDKKEGKREGRHTEGGRLGGGVFRSNLSPNRFGRRKGREERSRQEGHHFSPLSSLSSLNTISGLSWPAPKSPRNITNGEESGGAERHLDSLPPRPF